MKKSNIKVRLTSKETGKNNAIVTPNELSNGNVTRLSGDQGGSGNGGGSGSGDYTENKTLHKTIHLHNTEGSMSWQGNAHITLSITVYPKKFSSQNNSSIVQSKLSP